MQHGEVPESCRPKQGVSMTVKTSGDWVSQVHGGSVAVSSVGVQKQNQSNRSRISSSSCSSARDSALQIYQPKDSMKDLKAFADVFAEHLRIVIGCLSQSDKDLAVAAGVMQNFMVELVGAAQVVLFKLATTACSTLENLPSLLWAARSDQDTQLKASIAEVHDSMAALRKETQVGGPGYTTLWGFMLRGERERCIYIYMRIYQDIPILFVCLCGFWGPNRPSAMTTSTCSSRYSTWLAQRCPSASFFGGVL